MKGPKGLRTILLNSYKEETKHKFALGVLIENKVHVVEAP